jgi:tetratricopeptide (TPR) repeat protein
MKFSRLSCLVILPFLVFFAACGGHKNNATADNTNPVFSSDPKLKKITADIIASPTNAALYFERGQMLYRLKQDTLALRDFKKATVLDSTRAEYFSAVGNLLFEHKDIAGSVQWLQKAIALNPEDVKAHLKIAKLFLYTQDYAKGFVEVNTVLRKNPYNAEAYFLKGMMYKDQKDTAKALSSFETARSVDPNYEDAVVQIALIYSAQKNPLALDYLDNAFKIDSTDVFPIFAKGVYYQDRKEDAKAKELFKDCIIRNTHYVDAYFHMGYILMQEDSFAKSYRQYDIVTKIDPGNPAAYYNRGVCSELMDSVKKAVDDYRLALSLDTSYKSPKEALKRLKAMK